MVHTEPLRWSWQAHQREAITLAEKRLGFIVTGRPNTGPTFEAEQKLLAARSNAKYKYTVINP